MKTSLETWAFTFLAFGIVLPLVMGTLAHLHKMEEKVKLARVEGCEFAKRYKPQYPVSCDILKYEEPSND